MSETNRIIFLGGGAASGKSTAYRNLSNFYERKEVYISNDKWIEEHAKDPRNPTTEEFKEAKSWEQKQLETFLAEKQNLIILDTTLRDAELALGRIQKAKLAGYEVWILAISTDIYEADNRNRERAKIENRSVVDTPSFIRTHDDFHKNIIKLITNPDVDRAWIFSFPMEDNQECSFELELNSKVGWKRLIEERQLRIAQYKKDAENPKKVKLDS